MPILGRVEVVRRGFCPVADAVETPPIRSIAIPTSATTVYHVMALRTPPSAPPGADELRAPDGGGDVAEQQVRRPDRRRDRQQPQAVVVRRPRFDRRSASCHQREARDHRHGDEHRERDEVPVQGDVDDVLIVLRGHAAGETASGAVQRA